ncbi:TPA: hypothetical protein PKR06_001961 [Staphylococcus aureus]|nr:hypothetical protein [Staphylococcus aureus]
MNEQIIGSIYTLAGGVVLYSVKEIFRYFTDSNLQRKKINLDNGIKQGDKVLFQGSKYLVDGSIGNLLLISNDKDDRQVTVQDVKKVDKE